MQEQIHLTGVEGGSEWIIKDRSASLLFRSWINIRTLLSRPATQLTYFTTFAASTQWSTQHYRLHPLLSVETTPRRSTMERDSTRMKLPSRDTDDDVSGTTQWFQTCLFKRSGLTFILKKSCECKCCESHSSDSWWRSLELTETWTWNTLNTVHDVEAEFILCLRDHIRTWLERNIRILDYNLMLACSTTSVQTKIYKILLNK